MIVSLLRRVLEMKKKKYLFGVSIVLKKLCLIFPSSVHELKVGKSKHNDSKPLQKKDLIDRLNVYFRLTNEGYVSKVFTCRHDYENLFCLFLKVCNVFFEAFCIAKLFRLPFYS